MWGGAVQYRDTVVSIDLQTVASLADSFAHKRVERVVLNALLRSSAAGAQYDQLLLFCIVFGEPDPPLLLGRLSFASDDQ